MARTFTLPPRETTYYREDGGEITLGEMLDGIAPELAPTDALEMEDLLFAFGAHESEAQAQEAALRLACPAG